MHGASRRLRVAIVAPSLSILGGQSVQAHELLQGLSREPSIEPWLVPINPEPPGPLKPMVRVKYLRTLATQLTYWPLLCREIARADVVHVFSASYFSFLLAPLPAMTVARWWRRPVLLNYHSGEAPDHLRRSRIARAALKAVAHNVVPSPFLAGVFAQFGIAAEVIPNVVERSRFRYRHRERLRPRLLSTRNFEPLYNVACTLRAFRRVQDARPDATLTLVGAGSQAPALERLARDLGLRHVRFLGRVPPAEMARHYAEADIYVQTPDIDNMPVSVLEAFASGLPVVSTEAGGVPALVTHEVHGLLTPLDDDAAVAAGVLRLLDDPALARRLGEAAYAATDSFAWENVRHRWIAAYRRLAGTAGAPIVEAA